MGTKMRNFISRALILRGEMKWYVGAIWIVTFAKNLREGVSGLHKVL